MVCSSCGQERPDGDRFCGRCGTPLPHRLLSVEGTLSLARGRWENSSSHRTSTAGAGVLELPRANTTPRASEEAVSDVSSRDSDDSQITSDAQPADLVEQASSIETPDEAPSLPTEFASTPEVQEAPPSEPLDSSAQAPISPPEETATTSETSERQPDVSEYLDSLATTPAEVSPSNEPPHFPWMDDVLEQIDLEAAKAAKASTPSDERLRFLDLLGDLSQPETAQDPTTTAAATPFSEAQEVAEPGASSTVAMAEAMPSTRKRRVWLTIAAALVFVALAAVQWRSQITRNSRFMQQRINQITAGGEAEANKTASAAPADPIDLNNPPSHSSPTESQAKPQPQTAAANASAPITTGNESPMATKPTTPPPTTAHVQPAPTQEEPDTGEFTGPGAREMMRAKYAKTPLVRSVWLWKATAKGNPDAPLQLADLYIAGEGVPRSCEQGMVLLKTAALGKNALACNRLASLYSTGTCVPRSQLEAYRWFSSALAADPNNQAAQRDRGLVWEQMTPEERGVVEPPR